VTDPGAEFEALRSRIRARTVTVAGSRRYVAEGDLLLDEAELDEYVQRRVEAEAEPESAPRDHEFVDSRQRLLAATRGGRIVRWRDGFVLTYALTDGGFSPLQAELLRTNMREAARAWEGACGVRFAEVPADGGEPPLFRVVPTEGGELYAAAFFPDWSPDRRLLVVDPSYFGPSLPFDRIGVLRHELGHVLGFRHEHIRRWWLDCDPESMGDTKALTEYDSQSAMHYLCEGLGSPSLELTDVDREGAQRVYGPPLGEFELVP
jgi:hypothetical protein